MTGPRPTVNTRQARRADTVLCAAPHCRSRGRHRSDCTEECRGCLPRQAADGVYLCTVCCKRLGEDALLLVARYSDLELVLTGGRALGELVKSSKDPNLSINERAADLRQDIARTLDTLCAWISRQRGITPPQKPGFYAHVEELPKGFIGPPRWIKYQIDAVLENASFVGRHRDWLAAQSNAGETSEKLHDLAHGEAYRVAYPSGGRSFPVQTPNGYALCAEDGCEGVLWSVMRHADSPYPAELVCNGEDQHAVQFVDWFRQAKKLRAKAGVDAEPAPPPPRGTTVELVGGPFDGRTHVLTVSPPPSVLTLTVNVTETTTQGWTERRYSVAYTRRHDTEYHYVGATG